jgi:glutamyl-tRNA synthetase
VESETVIRLIELFNVKIENKTVNSVTATFISESYEDVRKIKAQLIQWILKGEELPCQVVMQDASVTEGFAESDCKKLKPDAIIQFERFGFVRIDEVSQKLIAYYAHK